MIETVVNLSGSISGAHDLSGDTHLGFAYGTLDYNNLFNHPHINDVELKNHLSFEDLGITEISADEVLDLFSDIHVEETI